MENQIYKLHSGKDYELDFAIFHTNQIDPYKEKRELGIVVTGKDLQIDFDLDIEAIGSLIKYLEDSMEYIILYNSKN